MILLLLRSRGAALACALLRPCPPLARTTPIPSHPCTSPPPHKQVQELLFLSPGLFYDFGGEQLSLAERAFERNRERYSQMGSYEV